MGKYNQARVKRIIAMIEEDTFTIVDICRLEGISRKVFYEWKSTKPEFSEAVEDALEYREEKLRQTARKAMMQKLEGYKQVETRTTYLCSEDDSDMQVKKCVVRERFCVPETSAITYSLSSGRVQQSGCNSDSSPTPLHITVLDEAAKKNLEYLKVRVGQK